ncbi:hypothetical protein Tco_0989578 [Tanacetum coccineum]|uniref:Uncharacterized protein n=1 Tax=Tanacetum coccineum TaxID=301880 RepID=A0ABQ5EUI9_9ASTR
MGGVGGWWGGKDERVWEEEIMIRVDEVNGMGELGKEVVGWIICLGDGLDVMRGEVQVGLEGDKIAFRVGGGSYGTVILGDSSNVGVWVMGRILGLSLGGLSILRYWVSMGWGVWVGVGWESNGGRRELGARMVGGSRIEGWLGRRGSGGDRGLVWSVIKGGGGVCMLDWGMLGLMGEGDGYLDYGEYWVGRFVVSGCVEGAIGGIGYLELVINKVNDGRQIGGGEKGNGLERVLDWGGYGSMYADVLGSRWLLGWLCSGRLSGHRGVGMDGRASGCNGVGWGLCGCGEALMRFVMLGWGWVLDMGGVVGRSD